MKKVRMFTLLWGERYIDWFERACVTSLCWPSNQWAVKQNIVGWDIVTKSADEERVRSIAERLGIPVEIRILIEDSAPVGNKLQYYLMDQMKRSLERDESMFLCPPDKIFGDGSISGILSQGSVCVASPHVRVLPSVLEFITDQPLTNPQLAKVAWGHLHRSWKEADISKEMANSYVSGVAWREISPGLIAVHHRLPTCFLATFQPDDVAWFESQVYMGAWDHLWPAKLVAEQRERVLGSSDAAFMAEITPEFENIPSCSPVDQNDPDRYWANHAHHLVNRNQVSFFRLGDA